MIKFAELPPTETTPSSTTTPPAIGDILWITATKVTGDTFYESLYFCFSEA
jgi:hypothetical protein